MHLYFCRNWFDEQKLCSAETNEVVCREMSFDPSTWKNLLFIGNDDDVICLWNIEQSNEQFLLTAKYELHEHHFACEIFYSSLSFALTLMLLCLGPSNFHTQMVLPS